MSPGVSLDHAIAGINAGVEQARKVAGQLVREGETDRPTATTDSASVELPDPDETMGTNIDEMA